MTTTSSIHYVRISPRKLRLLADLIRGKKVDEAQTLLDFVVKRGTANLSSLLKTAVAAAQNDAANLKISSVVVHEGPKLKRFRARAHGVAFPIQKKTSHITLVLQEIVPAKQDKQKPVALKAVEQKEEKQDTEKKKTMPRVQRETAAPKAVRGLQRIFRRKAI
jgi:large subunit ribosomal protein L22